MQRFAAVLAIFGVVMAVHELWPSPVAASSPGGVSLARDWVADQVEAQPLPYLTRSQGDARYCKLTGCTLTGSVTGPGFTASGVAGFNLSASNGRITWTSAGRYIDVNEVTGTLRLTSLGLSAAAEVQATTYLRSIGVATGSLPTCNATVEGAIEYDTTLNRAAICDDSSGSYAWRYLAAGSTVNTLTPNIPVGSVISGSSGAGAAASEDVNFLGPGRTTVSANFTKLGIGKIACNWATAGTGGTTGVVVQVYNVTSSAEICSCTLGACTTSARVPLACSCNAVFTDADALIAFRLKNTTDCTVNPTEVFCNAMGTITP